MGMGYNGADKHKQYLFEYKQDKLVAGQNVSITPNADGKTATISANGGGEGTVTDVLVDGASVVNQDGEAELSTMTGATSQSAGEGGLVPSPTIADKDKFLKGDGTWGEAGGGNVDDILMNGQSIVTNKIASFNNYVELTQSEYDALPSSKYTDGILYCIKDTGIVEGEKFAPIIYSLEEREIGVWTDGKPLYQKSYQLSNFTYNDWVDVIDVTTLNVDRCCKITGSIKRNNTNGLYISFDGSYYETDTYMLDIRYYNSNIQYLIKGYNDFSNMIVTLQYTKTTDTPGSGTWGTDGVPMVHYDGNEKVIGTWFGETLYENVLYFNEPFEFATTNTWTETPFNANSIEEIIMGRLQDGKGCNSCIATGVLNGKIVLNSPRTVSYGSTVKLIIQYTKSS
jgi:hypothetical protein